MCCGRYDNEIQEKPFKNMVGIVEHIMPLKLHEIGNMVFVTCDLVQKIRIKNAKNKGKPWTTQLHKINKYG